MDSYGIKSSQEFIDVTKATSASQFNFNSKYEKFKSKLKGIKEIPSNGTVTIVHGFKYYPVWLCFAESKITANHKLLSTASRTVASLSSKTDTNQVSIRDWAGTGARAVFYNILEDPVSLQ